MLCNCRYAYVEFNSNKLASQTLSEMQGESFEGNQLYLAIARPRGAPSFGNNQNRRGSGFRGRGGGQRGGGFRGRGGGFIARGGFRGRRPGRGRF